MTMQKMDTSRGPYSIVVTLLDGTEEICDTALGEVNVNSDGSLAVLHENNRLLRLYAPGQWISVEPEWYWLPEYEDEERGEG